MTVIFKSPVSYFVRNEYKNDTDVHRLTYEEQNEVLSYKDVSEEFTYCNWYGSESKVTCTLHSVSSDEFGNLLFCLVVTPDIPKHYCPTPFQILAGKGLLYPVSCQIIH